MCKFGVTNSYWTRVDIILNFLQVCDACKLLYFLVNQNRLFIGLICILFLMISSQGLKRVELKHLLVDCLYVSPYNINGGGHMHPCLHNM